MTETSTAAAPDPEIEAVIEEYFRGMYTGDVARLRRIFHPEGRMHGFRGGGPWVTTLEFFLDRVAEWPVPAESGEAYDMKVIRIHATASVAVAVVENLYQGRQYVDYLTLMNGPDGWKITNKAYHTDD